MISSFLFPLYSTRNAAASPRRVQPHPKSTRAHDRSPTDPRSPKDGTPRSPPARSRVMPQHSHAHATPCSSLVALAGHPVSQRCGSPSRGHACPALPTPVPKLSYHPTGRALLQTTSGPPPAGRLIATPPPPPPRRAPPPPAAPSPLPPRARRNIAGTRRDRTVRTPTTHLYKRDRVSRTCGARRSVLPRWRTTPPQRVS